MQMMPVIRLNDATFAELKTISTWLMTSTPSETIDELVREKLNSLGLERDTDEPGVSSDLESFQFDKAPGLSFTRLIAGKIGGAAIKKANWASLLFEMIAAIKAKGLSNEKLVTELQVPSRAHSYSEEGFKYYPAIGISIQGQSAQDAWKETERLAKKWKIPVEAHFQWRQNKKAQHPGRAGVLRVGGN
jgi:hypothetical protein